MARPQTRNPGTAPETAPPSALDHVAQEDSVLARIGATKAECAAQSDRMDAITAELKGAGDRYENARRRLEFATGRGRPEDEIVELKREVDDANARCKALHDDHVAAERARDTANAELRRLHGDALDSARVGMDAAMVIAYQAQIATASQAVEEIDALIRAREQRIAGLPVPARAETEDALLEALGDVHAAHAMGLVTDIELQARASQLQDELTTLRQGDLEQDAYTEALVAAIDGLRRQRATALAALDDLLAKKQQVLGHFLRTELEAVGARYVEAASAAKEAVLRLVALDNLAKAHGVAGVVGLGWAAGCRLPAFRIRACEGLEHPNWPGTIFDAGRVAAPQMREAEQAERSRIEALGVEF